MPVRREIMGHDTSRSLRQAEIDERLRYERQHAAPGEIVDVLCLETDSVEMAHCLSVLLDDRMPRSEMPTEPPGDGDSVTTLHDWGLTTRQVNMLERGCRTIGELREAIRKDEVTKWPGSGEDTLRKAVAALARIDEAKQ